MKPDLSNARIVLVTDVHGDTGLHIRSERGAHFQEAAYTLEGAHSEWLTGEDMVKLSRTSERELATDSGIESLRILASFPEPTIAEIVGDATRFEFVSGTRSSIVLPFVATLRNGKWEVCGYDDAPRSLEELREAHRIDLRTIVPLEPAAAWLEAQR